MPHFGIIRVSTTRQAEQGVSIAAHIEILQKWGIANGADWGADSFGPNAPPGFFIDAGQSAFVKNFVQRPGTRKLFELLRPGDSVVCVRLDRLFRRVKDVVFILEEFRKRKIRLVCLEPAIDFTTAMGRLVAHMLTAFAEFESEMRSQYATEACAQKKLRDGGPASSAEKSTRRSRSVDGVASFPASQPAQASSAGRVWIYTRCSHADSLKSGLGLQQQQDMGMREARRVLEADPAKSFGGQFEDLVVSAYKVYLRDRPQGKLLCEALRPGDVVILPKLCRGFRSVRDLLNTLPDWIERGIDVKIVDQQIDFSNWTGMAVCQILGLAAQIDSDIKSARTCEALDWLKEHGRRWNRSCPYFFKQITWRQGGQKIKQLVWDRHKISTFRLLYHYIVHLKRPWRDSLEVVERLAAKHQGRKPIPACGVHKKKRKDFKGKDAGKVLVTYPMWQIKGFGVNRLTWPETLEKFRESGRVSRDAESIAQPPDSAS